MKKVVFFIGSLQSGGTEAKLARNFLPLLKKRGRMNPKLLLLQERGEFLCELPEDMEKLSLNESPNMNLLQIIPRFREALVKLRADVVISFMWYPAIISCLARKLGIANFRHIIHDTVNMTEYIKDEFRGERFRRFKSFLFIRSYKDADAVIVNSKGIKSDFINNFRMSEGKIHVIYNPLNREMIYRMSAEDSLLKTDMPLIISAGRLIYQKGFDILLEAFRKVRDHCPSRLLILGNGGQKEALTLLTERLNLQNDVTFLGFQQNPFKFMKEASVFCLATRYEGFPNVVLESMTLGVPVVVTDCCSGPAEILDNGKYGILVPPGDPNAIADALIQVISDKNLREDLSRLSLKRAQDFSLDESLTQWEEIILGT